MCSSDLPLKGYIEDNVFKVYALDVGLLNAMANIEPDILVRGDRIFQEFKGAFVENYVAQQIKAAKGMRSEERRVGKECRYRGSPYQ